MNISLSWLSDYLDVADLPPAIIAERLTAAGLEVEEIQVQERVRGGLQGVVVGRVLTVEQHPNADRLRLTTVDVGQPQPLHIVCGAPNVAAGQNVLVATLGATIYPVGGQPLTMKEAKIRGELSQGMICAEDELGLGTSHDGILVLEGTPAPGTPAAQHLGLTAETVLVIGVTPNRMDALSHYGVARDLAAILDRPVKSWQIASIPGSFASPVSVTVADAAQCPLYTGRVIRNLTVAASPDWLQQRLQSIGLRPINNVVDVTNYVLHTTGQPLHAFDLAHIAEQKIEVRNVAGGMSFITLDGQTRSLLATDLLICDPTKPLCLAGTMGGLNSGVTDVTTSIFLEAAVFAPQAVRGQSRRLNLFSDSSYRFERGVDGNTTQAALDYATQLLLEICGGEASQVVRVGPESFPPATVAFDYAKAQRLIGKAIPQAEMDGILQRLEYEIEPGPAGMAMLHVPTYRQDVTRFQDVVEDIVRIYGLDNVAPATAIHATLPTGRATDPAGLRYRVANALAASGWQEILTNSLVPSPWTDETRVALENPLSEDLNVLRTSLLPNGLEAIAHNLARKQSDLRLFEFGKSYHHAGKTHAERQHLGLWLTGTDSATHWRNKSQPADYFHLHGAVQQLLDWLSLTDWELEVLGTDGVMQYGARVLHQGTALVRYGAVHGTWLQRFDIGQPVYYATFDWPAVEAALAARPKLEAQDLPKFPAVRRDLSLVVPANVTFAQLRRTVAQANPALIQAVEVLDVYEKADSYTLSLTIQDRNKTLTDDTVDKLVQRILALLDKELGVKLRG